MELSNSKVEQKEENMNEQQSCSQNVTKPTDNSEIAIKNKTVKLIDGIKSFTNSLRFSINYARFDNEQDSEGKLLIHFANISRCM